MAICDSEIMGRKFEEGNRRLDLCGEFFNGEEMSEEQVLAIIKDEKTEDATFNIVGEKSIGLALKAGIVKKEGIIKIQGIPIALTLL